MYDDLDQRVDEFKFPGKRNVLIDHRVYAKAALVAIAHDVGIRQHPDETDKEFKKRLYKFLGIKNKRE